MQKELPLFGHRNWIVVADSAYPLQTAPGIETIYANPDQLTVVRAVLAELVKIKHVQPTIYTDAELKYIAEKNAIGMSAHREALAKILATKMFRPDRTNRSLASSTEAGKTFKVFIIKTPLTVPYTSVFFQVECGYWNAASEEELRDAMRAATQ